MSEPKNQLRAGAVLSYVNLALSSLIPFFYTPVMLRMLGEAEYGLYSLSASVIGYLGLLTFGFGGTIVRYITMYRAKGEKRKEEETFGFFLLLYCVIGALIMVLGVILSFNVEPIFHKGLTGGELEKMQILMVIMAFNSALSLPVSVSSSIVVSHERYIFYRVIGMFSTVFAPACNLVMLYLGFASVGMAVTSTIIQFLMLPTYLFYCIKKLNIRPRFAKMPKGLIKEMVGFSAYIFIGTIVDVLFWATDKVILGMLAGTTVVAVYNIGATFNSMVSNLSTSLSSVLTPRITTMVVKDAPKKELTELFVRVGRLQYLIVALVVSGFTVFGRAFINLWAGDAYADSYIIAILTMFPLCIPLIQNTGLAIVTAQNKHKFRSVSYLIIAVVNVISTYLVVPYLGGIGAALCSGVSYIVGQGIIMNTYYYKVTGINIPLFWKNILKMSVIPVIMTIVGLSILKTVILDNWFALLIGAALYACIYAVLMYLLAMNEYERNIIKVPIYKIVDKLKSR